MSLLLQRKEPVPSGNDEPPLSLLLVRVIALHVIPLCLPFYMYGGPFEGISLHLSVMGGAGWWKNGFWANICPVQPASDKLALCITLPMAFVVWKCCCGPMGAVC